MNYWFSVKGVSEKYKELFNKRKLEETGDMDDDLAAHYADESDEEDEDEDEVFVQLISQNRSSIVQITYA